MGCASSVDRSLLTIRSGNHPQGHLVHVQPVDSDSSSKHSKLRGTSPKDNASSRRSHPNRQPPSRQAWVTAQEGPSDATDKNAPADQQLPTRVHSASIKAGLFAGEDGVDGQPQAAQSPPSSSKRAEGKKRSRLAFLNRRASPLEQDVSNVSDLRTDISRRNSVRFALVSPESDAGDGGDAEASVDAKNQVVPCTGSRTNSMPAGGISLMRSASRTSMSFCDGGGGGGGIRRSMSIRSLGGTNEAMEGVGGSLREELSVATTSIAAVDGRESSGAKAVVKRSAPTIQQTTSGAAKSAKVRRTSNLGLAFFGAASATNSTPKPWMTCGALLFHTGVLDGLPWILVGDIGEAAAPSRTLTPTQLPASASGSIGGSVSVLSGEEGGGLTVAGLAGLPDLEEGEGDDEVSAWQALAELVMQEMEDGELSVSSTMDNQTARAPPSGSKSAGKNAAHIVEVQIQDSVQYMEDIEILEKIGKGAFGTAYKARLRSTSEVVVAKEVDTLRMDEQQKEAAKQEVTVLASLDHPNIVRYYSCYQDGDSMYIIMEYCGGGDLEEYIKLRAGDGSSPPAHMSENEVMMKFVQICLALHHVHGKNMMHRDIKSCNVLMSEKEILKLGDFGISKVVDDVQSTMAAKTFVGTPLYLSPELVQQKPYNRKADIWALGVVLYELCQLRRPFEGSFPSLMFKIPLGKYEPIPEHYSSDLHGLVRQLLQTDPRKRPSCQDILSMEYVRKHMKRYAAHVRFFVTDRRDSFHRSVQPYVPADLTRPSEDGGKPMAINSSSSMMRSSGSNGMDSGPITHGTQPGSSSNNLAGPLDDEAHSGRRHSSSNELSFSQRGAAGMVYRRSKTHTEGETRGAQSQPSEASAGAQSPGVKSARIAMLEEQKLNVETLRGIKQQLELDAPSTLQQDMEEDLRTVHSSVNGSCDQAQECTVKEVLYFKDERPEQDVYPVNKLDAAKGMHDLDDETAERVMSMFDLANWRNTTGSWNQKNQNTSRVMNQMAAITQGVQDTVEESMEDTSLLRSLSAERETLQHRLEECHAIFGEDVTQRALHLVRSAQDFDVSVAEQMHHRVLELVGKRKMQHVHLLFQVVDIQRELDEAGTSRLSMQRRPNPTRLSLSASDLRKDAAAVLAHRRSFSPNENADDRTEAESAHYGADVAWQSTHGA